jgi:acyl-CoA synthetase (AMP-forming)/AMP-acid ligase II
MNLIDFFDKSAALYPDRAFFIVDDQSWSYRKVAQLANQTGHALLGLGLQLESKCAVLSRNSPLAFTVLLGILKAQCTWVPLNVGNGVEENIHILEFFDVEILFYEKEFEEFVSIVRERVLAVRCQVCLDASETSEAGFSGWVAGQPATPWLIPHNPDAVCLLRGTGGTTGLPKGVMNTNRNMETMIANYLAGLRFDAPPVFLACAPLSHAAGILAFVTFALAGTIVIQRKFSAQDTLQAIARHKVSFVYLPPTAIYSLLSELNVGTFDYSSLRHFIYGAAPTSATKLQEAIAVFGPVMTQAYGQTEVPSSVTFMAPSDHLDAHGNVNQARLLSCGRPTPFVRVALMDDQGNIVDRGNIGEVVVQGGLVMKGYYKNPEATAATSTYGWHHTGDLAYEDEDGFIYVCDRKKEIIITGGYNVFPLEVEQAILSHPAVQDCAVVGVPHEKWGEAIKAVVELKPGCTVTEEALIALCKEKIGHIKAPKSVDFIDLLPRSPVGKVMRKEVRKTYWSGQARSI